METYRRPTIKDLAEAANVSKTNVSSSEWEQSRKQKNKGEDFRKRI